MASTDRQIDPTVERLEKIVRDLETSPEVDRVEAVRAFEVILTLRSAARDQGRDAETFRALMAESMRLLGERHPRGSALTADRARYLVASGAYTQEQIDRAEEAIASGALTELEQTGRLRGVTESLSTGEVAALLGVDTSRVRHRQAAGLLYSFLVGRHRRYPSWQFTDRDPKVLPHLPALVAFIGAADLQHGTVTGVMATPQESLVAPSRGADAHDTRMTPAEWLAEGNDPREVLDIFESYLAA
jgi:hypothetical protein